MTNTTNPYRAATMPTTKAVQPPDARFTTPTLPVGAAVWAAPELLAALLPVAVMEAVALVEDSAAADDDDMAVDEDSAVVVVELELGCAVEAMDEDSMEEDSWVDVADMDELGAADEEAEALLLPSRPAMEKRPVKL
jgi:hypothetical protein